MPRFTLALPVGGGAGQARDRFIFPAIHGDGEQARDFAYIHDVVEANLLTAYPTQASCARVVNVAGGARPRSVNELLEMIAD